MLDESQMREALAAYAHEAWAGWMRYLFSLSARNPDGTVTIPLPQVQRWERQMTTAYPNLPEHEKESDRAEADRMLALIGVGNVTAAECRRASEYIREAWYGKMPAAEEAYALLWCTYLGMARQDFWRPRPEQVGIDADTALRLAADVENLILEMRNPMFDRDPVGP